MTRPTVTPPPGELVALADADAPDFLEAHRVVALAFVDPDQEASRRVLDRLAVVAAKLARPGFGAAYVDVTTSRLVAEAMGVTGVPVLFVFRDGETVDRLMGAPPAAVLEETLRPRLDA